MMSRAASIRSTVVRGPKAGAAAASPLDAYSIDTYRAAVRMDCTLFAVQDRCRRHWSDQGLAVKRGESWGIHPLAHPALADLPAGTERDRRTVAELQAEGVEPARIEMGLARRDVVLRLHNFKGPVDSSRQAVERIRRWLDRTNAWPRPGVKALRHKDFYRWRNAYRRYGLRGLIAGARRIEAAASGVPAFDPLAAARVRLGLIQRFATFAGGGDHRAAFARFHAAMVAEGAIPAPDVKCLSYRTLARWRAAFRRYGIVGLIPQVHKCGRGRRRKARRGGRA